MTPLVKGRGRGKSVRSCARARSLNPKNPTRGHMSDAPKAAAPARAAATATATTTATAPATAEQKAAAPLRLQLKPKPHVQWAKDVVDNEHMNKKSSKRCCIFHKQRRFGESDSDESDSDFEGDAPAPPKNRNYKPHETYHA
uniref:Protein phosphatase inhibitor n=1 Tax=Phaeomonas parva TaxID=124430 RepID=A0A7S1UFI5_9STRA